LRAPRQLIHSSAPEYGLSTEAGSIALPEQQEHLGMSLVQIVSILRFYWKYSLLIAAAVVLVSAIVIKLLPSKYTATTTLIVDPGKNDPLAVSTTLPNDQQQLMSYVATQVELIQSPVILKRVVDKLQLTADGEFGSGFNGLDAGALREYTEKNLAEALKIDLGRGGELLYISATAKQPVKAANIANAVADTYMEEEKARLSVPAGDRARLYAEDLAQLRAKVAAAQDKLSAFLQQKGITDLPTGTDPTDTDSIGLKALEQQLLFAQNQRRALEAKSAGHQDVADEALGSQVIQALRSKVSEQRIQLAQLSTTYASQHPKVIELKSQLALTTQELNNQLRALSENTATQLQRARELENKYTQAVAEQRAKVMNLREKQGQGAKLMLELDSAQSVYKRALDGYDHFLFASADKGSDVSLVSRATPPVKATDPNKIKLMFMGILAGMALGLALPFLYELLFSRRLRCRDDIERSFGIPVLAQLDSFAATESSA
jgi:succinoglycan biosynthesis transport protein ExoP